MFAILKPSSSLAEVRKNKHSHPTERRKSVCPVYMQWYHFLISEILKFFSLWIGSNSFLVERLPPILEFRFTTVNLSCSRKPECHFFCDETVILRSCNGRVFVSWNRNSHLTGRLRSVSPVFAGWNSDSLLLILLEQINLLPFYMNMEQWFFHITENLSPAFTGTKQRFFWVNGPVFPGWKSNFQLAKRQPKTLVILKVSTTFAATKRSDSSE